MDDVERAVAAVPRAGFLVSGDPEFDGPLPIGHGQTNSQPRTVAEMLRLLAVGPGQRVLDVGSGSGWTTALLAHLVGPAGQVLGVEIVPELVELGAANLSATQQDWANIRAAVPGVLGLPEHAPYDRILVSAVAPRLPEALVAQLAPDGRLVIPVDGEMLLIVNSRAGPTISRHGRYLFVPLRLPGPPK